MQKKELLQFEKGFYIMWYYVEKPLYIVFAFSKNSPFLCIFHKKAPQIFSKSAAVPSMSSSSSSGSSGLNATSACI